MCIALLYRLVLVLTFGDATKRLTLWNYSWYETPRCYLAEDIWHYISDGVSSFCIIQILLADNIWHDATKIYSQYKTL